VSSADGYEGDWGLEPLPCVKRVWELCCSTWSGDSFGGSNASPPVPIGRSLRRWSPTLHSHAWQEDKRQWTWHKLKEKRFRMDIRKNKFHLLESRVVEQGPRTSGQCPSLGLFKAWLGKALSSLVWPHSWAC